jgi:hypothetical protein
MNCTSSYSDIYYAHVYATLGQLTAMVLSTTVAVPVYSFYSTGMYKRVWTNFWTPVQVENHQDEDNEDNEDNEEEDTESNVESEKELEVDSEYVKEE